jgi:hypothetical protein
MGRSSSGTSSSFQYEQCSQAFSPPAVEMHRSALTISSFFMCSSFHGSEMPCPSKNLIQQPRQKYPSVRTDARGARYMIETAFFFQHLLAAN